ncbi:helix-turn-helix transcriptional regulator [Xanthobacter sp. KR7-225]|uniref:helix-turn-helix transcriptional regulator n=1 Tax=Xanthobacter sp. KR7-225 TaxID=3156613 RepID=UPI0032B42549
MIYDCVIAPEKWSAVVGSVCREFGFADAIFSVVPLPRGEGALQCVVGIDPDTVARMMSAEKLEHVLALWGGPERMPHYPIGEPVMLSQATDPTQWDSNLYYLEFGKPKALIDSVVIPLVRDPTMVGTLGLSRCAAAGPIGESEMAGLRLLAPHIRRAVKISNLFRMKAVEVSTFASTIDAFSVGVVLVGADLSIIHANAKAAAMLAAEDPILSREGRIAMRHEVASGALKADLRQAVQDEARLGQKGIAIPARLGNGAPCALHVLPLRRGTVRPGLVRQGAAAIFIAPAASPPQLPTDALALLYDLTPAEARIFELVCQGSAPAEIAQRLGIATSTAKTHLLKVFEKTGCRRQMELVKLAASLTLPV